MDVQAIVEGLEVGPADVATGANHRPVTSISMGESLQASLVSLGQEALAPDLSTAEAAFRGVRTLVMVALWVHVPQLGGLPKAVSEAPRPAPRPSGFSEEC